MDRRMTICPYCDYDNITGADDCEQCGQALSDQNLPLPATHVERCIVRDRMDVLHLSRPLVVVTPDTKIRDVLRLLAERAIGSVLVTRRGRNRGNFQRTRRPATPQYSR